MPLKKKVVDASFLEVVFVPEPVVDPFEPTVLVPFVETVVDAFGFHEQAGESVL